MVNFGPQNLGSRGPGLPGCPLDPHLTAQEHFIVVVYKKIYLE